MKTLMVMIVVARELVRLYGAREGALRILIGARLLLKSRFHPKGALWASRLEHCRTCSMFNDKLGTCGTPGETYFNQTSGRLESLGCWCILRHAARLPNKDCWQREIGLEKGWPDNLRPTDL